MSQELTLMQLQANITKEVRASKDTSLIWYSNLCQRKASAKLLITLKA